MARNSRSCGLMLALGLCVGCAALPDVNRELQIPAHDRAPILTDVDGILPKYEQPRALANLALEASDNVAQQKMLATIQAATMEPLTLGNQIRLLLDGEQTFRAVFSAISAARSHINMEYYIFEDVRSQGVFLSDLLVRKLNQGVAVNVIYDSVGSFATNAKFFNKLRHAGAQLVEFNPVNPLDSHGDYSLNNRDHRKLLIVDGTLAIIGGVNISATYESSGSGFSSGTESNSGIRWRDTDVELRGAVVERLQLLFMQVWNAQSQQAPAAKVYFPHHAPQGDKAAMVFGSSPGQAVAQFYIAMLATLRHAQHRIWITNAYFVPTPTHVKELVAAARRGVDVRLLLPATIDSDAVLAVARSHYEYLIEAGVKIFEMSGDFLHSKSMVVDSSWSMVGSSNFDYRSALFNQEVDVLVIDSEFAVSLEQQFLNDCASADPIDRKRLAELPLLERIKGHLIRLWPHLL